VHKEEFELKFNINFKNYVNFLGQNDNINVLCIFFSYSFYVNMLKKNVLYIILLYIFLHDVFQPTFCQRRAKKRKK
jgi:hypothetical protein